MKFFTIYVDRLSEGRIETFQEKVDPAFLDVKDGNLFFEEPVLFEGTAYLAETHLVLNMDVSTRYRTFCKICNDLISLPFVLKGLYITEELANIPSKLFDLEETLRDSILLEIPMYNECEGGCLMRKELNSYFKKETIQHGCTT